jgi:hypothetical protein
MYEKCTVLSEIAGKPFWNFFFNESVIPEPLLSLLESRIDSNYKITNVCSAQSLHTYAHTNSAHKVNV